MNDENLNDTGLTTGLLQATARMSEVSLSEARAAALLPIWESLIQADRALAQLDLGHAAAAGSAWGKDG